MHWKTRAQRLDRSNEELIAEVDRHFEDYKKQKQAIYHHIESGELAEDSGKAATRFHKFCLDPSYKRAFDLTSSHKVSRKTVDKLVDVERQFLRMNAPLKRSGSVLSIS